MKCEFTIKVYAKIDENIAGKFRRNDVLYALMSIPALQDNLKIFLIGTATEIPATKYDMKFVSFKEIYDESN